MHRVQIGEVCTINEADENMFLLVYDLRDEKDEEGNDIQVKSLLCLYDRTIVRQGSGVSRSISPYCLLSKLQEANLLHHYSSLVRSLIHRASLQPIEDLGIDLEYTPRAMEYRGDTFPLRPFEEYHPMIQEWYSFFTPQVMLKPQPHTPTLFL